MSLATRCNACGTVFRVVQDQLKISEGWVRCGRCNEIFNALEGLFDLDRDAPPEWSTPAWAQTEPDDRAIEPLAHDSLSNAFADGGADEPADPALVDRIDEHLFGPRRSEPHRKPLAHVDDRDRLEFADAQLDSDLLSDSSQPAILLDPDGAGAQASAPIESELPRHPEFLRRADREARWRRAPMRIALAFAALLLLVGLALQTGHQQRDLIAARWPEARPLLEQWCEVMACQIEPLRRIEDISVESSALTRVAGPGDAFRLSVALRNRGTLPLALPSVDLSLTDAGGQLVARRALAPQDFRVASATLAPGAESALQLLLSAGSPKVSGYTVEIFYP